MNNNTLPSGVGLNVWFSTDNGATWTTTEPAAASVTRIRWILTSALPPLSTATARFTVTVGSTPPQSINNCGDTSLGGTGSLDGDCHVVYVSGNYSISGLVFRDDGGTGGTAGDGIRNGTEGTLARSTSRCTWT